MFLGSLALPILKGNLAGKKWLVGTGTNFFLGKYEAIQTQAFASAVKADDVVFDIGAHFGYYTLLASRCVSDGGSVYAFEPSPKNLAKLRLHVRKNSLPNVTILDCAVSNYEGTAHFETQFGSGLGHLAEAGGIEVKVTSLDTLTASGRMPLPSVMKIDVEGAELEVLEGAAETIARAHPVIFLSVHSQGLKLLCIDLLERHGYSLAPMPGESSSEPMELIATPKTRERTLSPAAAASK